MEGTAETAGAVVGAVAAGAEGAAVTAAPTVVATVEGAAVGAATAATAAAPATVEAGAASVVEATVPVAAETAVQSAGQVVPGAETGVIDAALAEKVAGLQEELATAAEVEPMNLATEFARELASREKALLIAGQITQNDLEVPKGVEDAELFKQIFARVTQESGGNGNELVLKAQAMHEYFYLLARKGIDETEDKRPPKSVTGTKEWGTAHISAERIAVRMSEERQKRGLPPLTPEDVNVMAYAIYLEEKTKKKKGLLQTVLLVAASVVIGSGREGARQSTPEEITGQRRR